MEKKDLLFYACFLFFLDKKEYVCKFGGNHNQRAEGAQHALYEDRTITKAKKQNATP